MTTPKSVTILKTLIFLLISLQTLSQSHSSAHPKAPSPWPHIHPHYTHQKKSLTESQASLSPRAPPRKPDDELTPQYAQFLQACEKRLTPNCSEQVAEHILRNAKMPQNCCSRLIQAGPDCHRAVIDGEDEFFRENGGDKRMIGIKTDNLWKKCEKSVPPPKDKDYPRMPARQYRPNYDEFLEECAEKITKKCGTEVVYAIFKKDKKVDKGCCKKLMKMGRECHDELVKGLKNLGGHEKSEKEIKAKSDHVWKQCKNIVKD